MTSTGRLASLVRQAGALLAGILAIMLIGSLIVALIVFLPRAFPRERPPDLASVAGYLGYTAEYLQGLARGDLGQDARRRPLNADLLVAARRSLELLLISAAVTLPLGIGWGALLASVRRGAWSALIFGLTNVLISLPSFLLMIFAIKGVATLTLRTGVQLALINGYGLDRHLILPTAVLAVRGAAAMARSLQVAQEDILRQDWIRAARARGLGGWRLWWRHVLPALRVPLLGSLLATLRVLVGGLVMVDFVFGWGGLGRKMLSVTADGRVSGANDLVVAGGAVVLLAFFVVIDALGEWAASAGGAAREPGQ
jgi:peptide/nickel transport system permease protein